MGLRVLLFAFAATVAAAAPTFRADKNYPALGLRMRMLASSEPAPLPSPSVHTITFYRNGEETGKKDLSPVAELWKAAQSEGRWRDRSGNIFELLQPRLALPQDLGIAVSINGTQQMLCTKEEFELFAGKDSSVHADTLEWLAYETGVKPGGHLSLKTGMNLKEAAFIELPGTKTLAWTFVPAKNPVRYIALLKIVDGTPLEKARKNFEQQFLASVQTLNSPAKTLRKEPAAVADPSRDAARASIANLKGWWAADCADYILLTDVRGSYGRSLVKALQRTLPALRNGMAAILPPQEPITDVCVLRIFEDQDAYKKYMGDRQLEWSIGCWVPVRRELVLTARPDYTPAETLSVIQHEAFHQYLFYASARAENAMWFNEGHAAYFECANADSKGRLAFKPNWRKEYLQRNLQRAAAILPEILEDDHAAFYSGSRDDVSLRYAAAWGLVWYLRRGAKSGSAYSNILLRYWRELLETKDWRTATKRAFDGVDFDRLRSDFIKYWQ